MLIFQANNPVPIQERYPANAVNFFYILLTGKTNATIEVITPKIYKAELWFLCMTHCLIVLYNCMKFQLNSFMVVNLQSGHEMTLQMIKGK